MTWILLLGLAILGYLQSRQHRAVLERLDDIDTDVEAIVTARRELQEFIRRRVSERVAEFKTGGGRERLRARLARKAVSAETASQRSGRPNGAQGADGSGTGS